ncbi:MAG: hypothetical protein NTV02_00560 [Candidatus Zambryskibacteria bacterium]|nr:hypothetical protein [Candidatus Zambryskibacteria bacterium]
MFDFAQYAQFLNIPGVGLMFKIFKATAPLWLTAFFGYWLWNLWLVYRRTLFFAATTHVLLEIKLPKEIFKSPKAMEFLFNALYQTGGEGNWYDIYIKGKTRPWYSLELCSIDGKLHFFIWTRKDFKNLIEANLYSQYPGIEIYEVPDYTVPVYFDPSIHNAFAAEFELAKADSFPIKTYSDYGMDKDPKEEYKIDPMTPLVEFLASSLGTGQNAWVQILIRAHKPENWNADKGAYVDTRWLLGAADEVKKIRDKTKPAEGETAAQKLTEIELDTISAIERSVTKPGFDVGIRAIYVAPKEIFSPAVGAGIIAGFRHYNSGNLNSFKPVRNPDATVSFPWQDRKKKKRNKLKTELLDAYKNRGYFYNEFTTPHFVLNTESLATIFHLPSGIGTTSALERIGSRKAEAPSNLPL